MDSSVKIANVDKWIGIPKFISIKLFPLLQDHIQVTKDEQNIRFRVVNNEGTGNCFYESILASNVFRKKFPKFNDDHHMLRVKLQNHAVCNPGLARQIYQLYATPEEKLEEAINFLTENLENDILENGYFKRWHGKTDIRLFENTIMWLMIPHLQYAQHYLDYGETT
jgi:hypothetical protein